MKPQYEKISALLKEASGGRSYSKNCKSCGTMYSGSKPTKVEERKTCPKCGGELGSPNWK